jgi:hypothetical protein
MKKLTLTLTVLAVAAMAAFGQPMVDTIAQPSTIIGCKIDDSGMVTDQLLSEFSYLDNGKVNKFLFPDVGIIIQYSYTDEDYMLSEFTTHSGGHPYYHESYNYTYENGLIKTKNHLYYGMMDEDIAWAYTYDNYGRLIQLDQTDGGLEYFPYHWSYDYQNAGKTKIETFFTDYASEGVVVYKQTTYSYDENYILLSSHLTTYNSSGTCTGNTLSSYYYDDNGNTDHIVTQVLSDDGAWTNSEIKNYIRNELGRVVECQTGFWSAENDDWDITYKTIFDYNDDEMTLTVSLRKKVDGEWGWDIFRGQTLFFDSHLSWQQKALAHYYNQQINQLLISFQYTERPSYLSTNENTQAQYKIYPNPLGEVLNIRYSPDVNPTRVELYDVQGRLVLSQESNLESVSTANLPAGVYSVKVTLSNGKSYSDTVIKK